MNLINSIKGAARATKIFCKKNSPELLLAAGVVTFVGTCVMVAKETLKQQEIADEFHTEKTDIKMDRAQIDEDNYPEKAYRKDITGCYLRFVGKSALNYAPASALAGLSLTCFMASYGILKKRNVALLAAYNAVNEAFQAYRKRVIDKEGAEADHFYMTGQKLKTITVTDEDGKKHKEKMLEGPVDASTLYAFKFGKYKENGQRNMQWSDADPLFNDMYIRGMQNQLNDTLYCRTIFDDDHNIIQPGHVFLNEIRDILGEDHNVVGSIVGNLYSDRAPEDGCDGYINFHAVKGTEPDPDNPEKMIDYYMIYPNVDGVIYDLLDQWKSHKILPERDPKDMYELPDTKN